MDLKMTDLCSEFTEADSKTTQVDSRVIPLDCKIGQLDSTVNELACLHSTVGRLRGDARALKNKTGTWDSLIVRQFPPPFDELRATRWSLLWRGSRDGFNAMPFQSRCDGRANTLTVIMDKNKNIFHGFTPAK
jgi:hypothetical protein